jgi:hypothetical protein
LLGLCLGHIGRRHRRAGNSVADDFDEIAIGSGAAKYTSAKIDPGNLIAIRPVAVRACVAEHLAAVIDVLRGLVLLGTERHRCAERDRYTRRDPPSSVTHLEVQTLKNRLSSGQYSEFGSSALGGEESLEFAAYRVPAGSKS